MPGIYLHFPFCLKKCSYCNFYSEDNCVDQIDNYLRCLGNEIAISRDEAAWQNLDFQTFYLGGGTPSMLNAGQLELLISQLKTAFPLSRVAEITLEANPETVDFEKLVQLKQLGINRLNIGVQSFRDADLQFLGRIHSSRQAMRTIENAKKAGFENIGIDLIFGIPGQTLASWLENLTQAVAFENQHISTYGLTYEPGTPITQALQNGLFRPCPEELERDMYLQTIEFLESAGFEHYEISNFARPGFRSRHNQIYWREEPYLGLGASAHSFQPPVRWWNVANMALYQKMSGENRLPIESRETLSEQQQMIEFIFLGLRRKSGIDLKRFTRKFGYDFKHYFASSLNKIEISSGQPTPGSTNVLLFEEDQHLQLTPTGFLVYDEICKQFV